MSLSQNAPKRRRLDTALHKPFRSPLKAPNTPKPQAAPTAKPSPSIPEPAAPNLTSPKPSASQTSTSAPATSLTQASQTSPSTQPNPTTQSLTTLRARHTALLTQHLHLKAQLETSTQALSLEANPSRDASLVVLIQKWKQVSRAAAEEVFAGARDKVNRWGGVKGMREREREGRKRLREMDESYRDEGAGGGGGGGGGSVSDDEEEGAEKADGEESREEREARKEREGERDEREEERDGDGGEGEDEEVEDEVDEEGGYTMDMMLKSMGIQLDVIGFDKEMQRWVD